MITFVPFSSSPAGRLNAFCHVQFDSTEAMERACQLTGSRELPAGEAGCGVLAAGTAAEQALPCVLSTALPPSTSPRPTLAELLGRSLLIDAASSGKAAAARVVKPVEGCWFCLSNPNADVDLVASVGALGWRWRCCCRCGQ